MAAIVTQGGLESLSPRPLQEDELTQLLPYVLRIINHFGSEKLQGRVKVIIDSESKPVFSTDVPEKNQIGKILDLCQRHLMHRLIQEEEIGPGFPIIRHRFLDFNENKDATGIEVTYRESLGVPFKEFLERVANIIGQSGRV